MTKTLSGQYLVEQGVIAADVLDVALVEQKQSLSDKRGLAYGIEHAVVEIIAQMNIYPSAKLQEALGHYLNVSSVELSKLVLDCADFQAECRSAIDFCLKHNLDIELMHHWLFLPFSYRDNILHLALSQPQDEDLTNSLARRLPENLKIKKYLVFSPEIPQAIETMGLREIDPRNQAMALGQQLEQCHQDNRGSQILIQFIEKMLHAALCADASDIHFAPSEKTLRILFRVDGILQTQYRLHSRFATAASARLKVLANLDISETRLPQDGSFKLNINNASCYIRVSTQPSQFGESIVLRLHKQTSSSHALDKLGLAEERTQQLVKLMRKPHGLVLIAGPTGSGKSSTLYALIKSIDGQQRNIMTLEDPIECTLGETIRQTSIHEAIGLDFARALKSTLRQDPDVIMVGEIRDHESALMSLRLAMTGHLVLATVHCDSALNIQLRLRLLGLSADLFADQLLACLAQRLARTSCPHCHYLREFKPEEEKIYAEFSIEKILAAQGCSYCNHTGYIGRQPFMEILEVTPNIAELIAQQASVERIKKIAEENDFISIKAQMKLAVNAYKMAPEEAVRIAG